MPAIMLLQGRQYVAISRNSNPESIVLMDRVACVCSQAESVAAWAGWTEEPGKLLVSQSERVQDDNDQIHNKITVGLLLLMASQSNTRGVDLHDVQWWMQMHHSEDDMVKGRTTDLEIKDSTIVGGAGMGLFATVAFAKGDTICTFFGRWIAAHSIPPATNVYVYQTHSHWPLAFQQLLRYWIYPECQANFINCPYTLDAEGGQVFSSLTSLDSETTMVPPHTHSRINATH
jgi:hypothetical protein